VGLTLALVNLGAEYGNVLGRFNPDFDGITVDPGHFDVDRIANHDPFVNFA
jgi:hypothetical protein